MRDGDSVGYIVQHAHNVRILAHAVLYATFEPDHAASLR